MANRFDGSTGPLKIRIAAPCSESWDSMKGDDRVRHCDSCKLNVFNIKELTADDARALLFKSTGRVCGRVFQRSDGTVLTKDCPVALAKLRRKVVLAFTTMVALLLMIVGARSLTRSDAGQSIGENVKTEASKVEDRMRDSKVVGRLIEKLDPRVRELSGKIKAH